MIDATVFILDGARIPANKLRAIAESSQARFVATLDDAVDILDEIAASGIMTLAIHGGLVKLQGRPFHAGGGTRSDLPAAGIISCMISEGSICRVSEIRDDIRINDFDQSSRIIILTRNLEPEDFERVGVLANMHDADVWRCRDSISARARGDDLCRTNWREAPYPARDRNLTMFHASTEPLGTVGTTLQLDPERPLWVSPSPAFAACFGWSEVRLGSVIHGVDFLDEHPRVVISLTSDDCLESAIEPSYLHGLRVRSHSIRSAGACRGYEYLATDRVTIEHVEQFPQPQEILRKYQVCIEQSVSDQGDEWDGDQALSLRIREAFGMDPRVMIRYPSMRRQLGVWMPDETGRSPSAVEFFDAHAALRALRRCILPEISRKVQYAVSPAHGFQHACLIAHFALLLSILEDIPPIAPMVAGALHDCARIDDSDCKHHAERGARIAASLLPRLDSTGLGLMQMSSVVHAIRQHSSDRTPESSIQAVLQDADRLALAWERGYEARYFSTKFGSLLAKAGPDVAERSFRRVFATSLWSAESST